MAGESDISPDTQPKPGRDRCLLVADDEPCVLDPTTELLERAGYRILTATDSRKAVQVFEDHAEEISAVLLDYHMPGGSGTDVFEELQRIKPNVPVIMMSGFVEDHELGRFLGMGVVGFLQKPFKQTTLVDAVSKAIGPSAA